MFFKNQENGIYNQVYYYGDYRFVRRSLKKKFILVYVVKRFQFIVMVGFVDFVYSWSLWLLEKMEEEFQIVRQLGYRMWWIVIEMDQEWVQVLRVYCKLFFIRGCYF